VRITHVTTIQAIRAAANTHAESTKRAQRRTAMRKSIWLLLTAFAAVPALAFAHGAKQHHENVRVLEDVDHKNFDRGMKLLTQGLGVKCSTCHVKGDYASDAKPEKMAAREFLAATVSTKTKTVRNAALEDLLVALNKPKAKSPTKVWTSIDALSAKKPVRKTRSNKK
jgi:hypothetical protein